MKRSLWEKEFNKEFKRQFGDAKTISLGDFRTFVWLMKEDKKKYEDRS